jgi:hypothetical protein
MYHLLRKQIILQTVLLFFVANTFAQRREIHRPEHDDAPYYFGATFGYNSSYLHSSKSNKFLQDDSILVALPGSSGGIAIGLLATGRLSGNFQVRLNPQVIIGSARYFTYRLADSLALPGEPVSQKRTLPANIISFPLQLKFHSDRIDNFRVYMMGGIKYDIYFSSNASASSGVDVRFKSSDFGIEGGIGFNIYFPYFTLSPELKFSNGLSNILVPDPSLKYSSVFGKLQTRMIAFSLHFEY